MNNSKYNKLVRLIKETDSKQFQNAEDFKRELLKQIELDEKNKTTSTKSTTDMNVVYGC